MNAEKALAEVRDIIAVVDATVLSDKSVMSIPTTVAQFCSQYETPFDGDKVAAELAAKRGVTVEQVRAEWNGRRTLGLKIDKEIKTGNPTTEEAIAALAWIKSVAPDSVQFDVRVKGYGLKGTADIVIEKAGKRVVVEVKTSDKDPAYFAKGWNRELLRPFDRIPASKLASASLQVSCYALMLDEGPADQAIVLHLNGSKATAMRPEPVWDTVQEELEAFGSCQ